MSFAWIPTARKSPPIYEFFASLGPEYIATAIEDLVDAVSVVDLRGGADAAGALGAGGDLFCVSVNWPREYDPVCEVIRTLPSETTTVDTRLEPAVRLTAY